MSKQVGGDVNPVLYGGSFYFKDPEEDEVEVIILQPLVEHMGEDEAGAYLYPFWVKTLCVTREDVAGLLENQGWRSYTDADNQDLPDPATASWADVAALVAADEGYGHFDWEQEGNLSGEAIHARYGLVDFQGESLEEDLLEEDREHADRRST